MNRECRTCEWGRDEHGPGGTPTGGLECREGPRLVSVSPAHWCGRWRLREELIRSGAHLAPTEILKHFEKGEAS